MCCEHIMLTYDRPGDFPLIGCAHGNHWHVTEAQAAYACGLDEPRYSVPALVYDIVHVEGESVYIDVRTRDDENGEWQWECVYGAHNTEE